MASPPDIRRSLAHAYAAVAGDTRSRQLASVTLDSSIAERIRQIEGSHPDGRDNAIERISRVAAALGDAVAEMAELEAL